MPNKLVSLVKGSSLKDKSHKLDNMTHPKTYKAIQVKKAGAPLEVSEVEWKDPQHGQVVVKVLACGVCHSDGAVIHQHMPTGLPRVPGTPAAALKDGTGCSFKRWHRLTCASPGHEIIGDVVAVGEGEKLWKVGERVGGGWHGGHCFECSQCRKGNFILCENENINGKSQFRSVGCARSSGFSRHQVRRRLRRVRHAPIRKCGPYVSSRVARITRRNRRTDCRPRSAAPRTPIPPRP